jgi:hypothetical protein
MELIKYTDTEIKDLLLDWVDGMDVYVANLMPKKKNEFTFFVYIDEGKEFSKEDVLNTIKKYEYSDMIIFDENKSIVALSIFANKMYGSKDSIDADLKSKELKFSTLEERIKNNFGYINKIYDDK